MGDVSALENTPAKKGCCVCGTLNVQSCGKCHSTLYCSKDCEVKHLPYHTSYCSAIVDLRKLEANKLYHNHSVREEPMDVKSKRKIMRLVGEKPILKCLLDNKFFEVLRDTGSMISLVDKDWVEEHFPEKKIYYVDEFLENECLHVQAANSTEITYDGVILLKFSLKFHNDSFDVPVLVTNQKITEPILGFNVIEHLILNGTEEEHTMLESCLHSGTPFKIEPLISLIQEKAKVPDLLAEIKASNTIKIPAICTIQIK